MRTIVETVHNGQMATTTTLMSILEVVVRFSLDECVGIPMNRLTNLELKTDFAWIVIDVTLFGVNG